MNYRLTKAQAKELLENKLSHFIGVEPQNASDEQYYKAVALVLRDLMSKGRTAWGCSRYKEGCDWRLYFEKKE